MFIPSITWAKYRPLMDFGGLEFGEVWFVDVATEEEDYVICGYVSTNGTFHEDI